MPFVRGMARLLSVLGRLVDGISESGELEPQRIARGNRLERGIAELFQFHPESLVGFGSGLLTRDARGADLGPAYGDRALVATELRADPPAGSTPRVPCARAGRAAGRGCPRSSGREPPLHVPRRDQQGAERLRGTAGT